MNYSSYLPTRAREQVRFEANSSPNLNQAYFLYRSVWSNDIHYDWPLPSFYGVKNERVILGRCSECDHEVVAQYVSSDHDPHYTGKHCGFVDISTDSYVFNHDTYYCPFCDTECIAVHSSYVREERCVFSESYCDVTSIDTPDGKLATIVYWCFENYLVSSGRTYIKHHPLEAYVCTPDGMKKYVGYSQYKGNIGFTGKWTERKRCTDLFGQMLPDYVFYNDGSTEGTLLENSKIMDYINYTKLDTDTSLRLLFPSEYAYLYLRHNNVENLITTGALRIVNYYLADPGSHNIIDWNLRKPSAMLGLNKNEFRFCVAAGWDIYDLEAYSFFRDFNGIDPHDLCYIEDFDYSSCMDFVRIWNMPIMRVIGYLYKQAKSDPELDYIDIAYYSDHLRMCEKLEYDLTDPHILYPRSLRDAHDREAKLISDLKDHLLLRSFTKRTKELMRYGWLADGLFIIPARSAAELCDEGNQLSHCVASYAQRHADGDTAIFFIRHTMEPHTSYFTLELDEKNLTVKQNRGLRNCARTPEVEAFEEKWLNHIREMRKEDEKNGKRNNKERSARKRSAKSAA